MRLADERHHVVLAVRVERDVAHQHEIVIGADLAEGAVEHVGRQLAISAVKLVVGVDDAPRRVEQAFAVGIVARIGDQRPHRGQRVLARGLGRGRLARRSGHDRAIGSGTAGLGQGFTTASICGLRSTGQQAGGVTGAAASVLAQGELDPCAATGRRIPILHAFARGQSRPRSLTLLRSRRPMPIYSCERALQSTGRPKTVGTPSHAERRLQQPNSGAGGQYPADRPARGAGRHGDGPFEAVRFDRHGRSQDDRRHGDGLCPRRESLRAGPGLLVDHGAPCDRREGRRTERACARRCGAC